MQVNGQLVSIDEETTLREFLLANRYELAKIAVERNGTIVPKSDYETTILTDEDSLEVVSFVGGG